MSTLIELMGEYIPTDDARQVTSKYYVEHVFRQGNSIKQVMDLGCGVGDSAGYFKQQDPTVAWVGLDVEKRWADQYPAESGIEFCIYDGVQIPFEDNRFDLIYCNQVFEYVKYPAPLAAEICRILRPNGYFLGSTSQLEPYHASSLHNYTPYGFCLLLQEAGLQMIEVRPGIDGITLIIRRGLWGSRFFSRWWEKESPLNLMVSIFGKLMRKNPTWINTVKLLFCGQFCFLSRKPMIQSGDRS